MATALGENCIHLTGFQKKDEARGVAAETFSEGFVPRAGLQKVTASQKTLGNICIFQTIRASIKEDKRQEMVTLRRNMHAGNRDSQWRRAEDHVLSKAKNQPKNLVESSLSLTSSSPVPILYIRPNLPKTVPLDPLHNRNPHCLSISPTNKRHRLWPFS